MDNTHVQRGTTCQEAIFRNRQKWGPLQYPRKGRGYFVYETHLQKFLCLKTILELPSTRLTVVVSPIVQAPCGAIKHRDTAEQMVEKTEQ